ncbi:ASPIC/UnbV domain-containing protein [Dokdonella sp.]|uniref:ASPIC/UnbV domain-containing protein n=1 Tax=Dokdonella sp. TaxID=2291710 RepID=UPI003C55BE9A
MKICFDGGILEAHFGLGTATMADTLDIRWPDGRTTRIGYPKAQALLVVDDPDLIFRGPLDGPSP